MKNNEKLIKATWKEWTGLSVLTIAVFMMATDLSILYLAIPQISADLQPSASGMLWIIHIGELLTVGFALTMGYLGDAIGRRRLLLIGVFVYGAASLLAAFSTAVWMLIGARALLGAATATMMPSTMSLLKIMFKDERQFSLAIAINLSAFSAGMSLGPPIGGMLLEHFWWGAVFLVNVPFAALLLLTSPVLPEYRNPAPERLDLRSVLLSLAALILLVYGLQELAEKGLVLIYIVCVALGAILGTLFIRRQKLSTRPILDLKLFSIRVFRYSLIILGVMLLVTAGTDMLFAQHLQIILGLSPIEAGLLLVIPALLSILGTMMSPVLTRWMRPAYAIIFGIFFSISGALLIVFTIHDTQILTLITGVSLIGFGGGPAMTLTSEKIVASAPQEKAGSASAMSDVGTGLGSALSVAFIGSIGMLVYRLVLPNITSTSVPGEVVEASKENLGTAMVLAQDYPAIIGAVEFAFSIAMQSIYSISAAGLILLAGFVAWKFRDVTFESTEEQGQDAQSHEQETRETVSDK